MAIIDTSIVNPAAFQLTPQTGGITQRLLGVLQQKRQETQRQDIAQANKLKEDFKLVGDQMLRVRGISEYTSQRKEMARLAQDSIKRGENPTVFTDALNIDNPDELNLYLTRVATQAGNIEGVIDQRTRAAEARDPKTAGKKAFQPITLVNPDTKEKMLVSPVVSPAGVAELSVFDIPEGFEISRETPEEKRAADILTIGKKKGAEVTGKGQAARRQTTINRGVESSEGLANLKRAKTLLETVKTGGINAASLRAKQLFGVEGEDEGELSNRLGKAVLSQLRETFGAAFTAQEGASLARIEAGFGKSSKANKRLIDQLIKMVEKKGSQGISAAVAAEDFEAAQLIKDNMAFTLDIEPPDELTAEEQAELSELKKRFPQ